VVAGVPTTFSVTYASQAGSRDIASGQVQIDSCYLGWDSSGNIMLLPNSPNEWLASGTLGQNATIWGGSCSIDLVHSSLSPVAGNADQLTLSLALTFPEQSYLLGPDFFGRHEVSASGTSAGAEGLTTAMVDLGALVVNQGPDFTLSVTPSGGDPVTLSPGAPASLTLTATGLNGFNGSISIGAAYTGSPACFSVAGVPPSMPANAQRTITIAYLQTPACPPGVWTQFTIVGEVNRGLPNDLNRSASSTPRFVAGAGGDFTITVGYPSAPWLSATGSVSYPVTVQSVGGQSGTVSLNAPGGVPVGVGWQLDNTTLYLNPGGTAGTTLTLTGSENMPGGTYPMALTATLTPGNQRRTAAFSLGTQVTGFQVTSATGSAIVHNTGQEVQVTHSVPAGNAPSYTTCDTADPDVTCQVASTAPDSVTLRITASPSAAHGTRVLRLNSGAMIAHAAVGNRAPSGISISPASVQAGEWTTATVTISAPDLSCGSNQDCAPEARVIDLSGNQVDWATFDYTANVLALAPPSGSAGAYFIEWSQCSSFIDPGEDYFACIYEPRAPLPVRDPDPEPPQQRLFGLRTQVLTPPVANDGDAIIATIPFTLQVEAVDAATGLRATNMSGVTVDIL